MSNHSSPPILFEDVPEFQATIKMDPFVFCYLSLSLCFLISTKKTVYAQMQTYLQSHNGSFVKFNACERLKGKRGFAFLSIYFNSRSF